MVALPSNVLSTCVCRLFSPRSSGYGGMDSGVSGIVSRSSFGKSFQLVQPLVCAATAVCRDRPGVCHQLLTVNLVLRGQICLSPEVKFGSANSFITSSTIYVLGFPCEPCVYRLAGFGLKRYSQERRNTYEMKHLPRNRKRQVFWILRCAIH